MNKRNLNSPWNPALPVNITPEEYEKQVVEWLKSTGESLTKFKVNHLIHLFGQSGEYEFDAVAEFTILAGAKIVVLIECKRYNRPVERDHVMTLWAKLQDVNAQKAMIFSTCGFQSGALEYAQSKNIASVIFVGGTFLYETKSVDTHIELPTWVKLPEFAGIVASFNDGSIECTTIDNENIDGMRDYLFG